MPLARNQCGGPSPLSYRNLHFFRQLAAQRAAYRVVFGRERRAVGGANRQPRRQCVADLRLALEPQQTLPRRIGIDDPALGVDHGQAERQVPQHDVDPPQHRLGVAALARGVERDTKARQQLGGGKGAIDDIVDADRCRFIRVRGVARRDQQQGDGGKLGIAAQHPPKPGSVRGREAGIADHQIGMASARGGEGRGPIGDARLVAARQHRQSPIAQFQVVEDQQNPRQRAVGIGQRSVMAAAAALPRRSRCRADWHPPPGCPLYTPSKRR